MKPARMIRQIAGHTALPTMMVLLLHTALPAIAQQSECDCSCDAYRKMMSGMQDLQEKARSGDYDGITPEELATYQCAGTCAMQWSQCGDASAQGTAGSQEPADDGSLSKDRLTPDYLQGMWCSIYSGHEKAQWSFNAEGGYRVGLPAGRGYAMQPNVRSLEQFHDRFETLVDMSRDTFTTENEHGRKNIFTRGACN